jgi:hypothetical protein
MFIWPPVKFTLEVTPRVKNQKKQSILKLLAQLQYIFDKTHSQFLTHARSDPMSEIIMGTVHLPPLSNLKMVHF